MNNPNELRPVIFTRGREDKQLSLRFDPETQTVVMDPVPLSKLNLSDFRRIHGFFRRVQGMKMDNHQPTVNVNCMFADLNEGDVFKTPSYPHATLRRTGDNGEILTGSVKLDEHHYLQAGIVEMTQLTPVEKL